MTLADKRKIDIIALSDHRLWKVILWLPADDACFEPSPCLFRPNRCLEAALLTGAYLFNRAGQTVLKVEKPKFNYSIPAVLFFILSLFMLGIRTCSSVHWSWKQFCKFWSSPMSLCLGENHVFLAEKKISHSVIWNFPDNWVNCKDAERTFLNWKW